MSTITTGTIAAETGITLGATPNTGYSFTTWNVEPASGSIDLNDDATEPDNGFTMPSVNVSVNATFTKNNYNVTLGTIDDVVLSASDYDEIDIAEGETEAVPYGTELILEADMASGKMFAWKVVKTGVTPEAVVTNEVLSSVTATDALLTVPAYAITVTGTVQDLKYYVTYDANGGIGTLVDPDSPYTPGEDVTVLANTFTYSGHVFTNWNTEAGGGGTDYDAGDEISDIDADVTLYAQWAEAWTVTLNANGSESTVLVPKENSTTLTAPANIPDGYVYKGWTANASTPSVWVSNDYTPEEDVTLYAVYAKTEQEYAETSVILDGQGLSTSSGLSQNTERDVNGFTYMFNSGIKGQASNGTNKLSSENAIFVPSNAIIYNETPFGQKITKFEVFANQGASTSAAAGVQFSNTAITSYATGDNTWTATLSTTNHIYDASGKLTNAAKYFCFKSTDSSKAAQVQFRITYIAPLYYTRIYPSGDVKPGENTTITTPTVISSGTVMDMETYSLTIGAGGSLTIEDGGQLITNSSIPLTYKKQITSAAKDGGWYTISTPVHTKSNTFLEHESVENMILTPATNYDLFYYNETTHYWMNYKQAEFDLNVGQGYLYRNNGAELHFAGYNNQATSYNVALSYASTEDKLLGFNLIGNPYPQNITMSDVTVNNGGTLSGGYVLSKDGAWSADVAATIAPAQGFLVQIDKTGVTATITKPTGGSKSRANNDYIKFIVANSQHEDAAFALFEEGYGLNKIDHRNSDIPMLYIPKEGHNFAIATMDDNTQSFNLNLKAKTTGKYTLTYKATGNYSYLHVIDRLTGEDVDMLMEGEYSFIASPSDAENRFIVRLEYSNGYENSEDSIFAYQSGSDIIVNGEGELQIFDVMGRRILTQYVSGVETINLQSHGVYIFKLNEKTQKIVVR